MSPPGNGKNAEGVWEPDQVLSDRYRVVQEHRRSASAYTYKVADVFREVPHLLLSPSPRALAASGGLEWFVQFCRNALSVPHHPNLLAARRMDYEGRVPYLVMDYVEGRYWDQVIDDGDLADLGDMLDVAIQVARGLEWLHENGRVHGNLKPANVLIDEQTGVVEVIKYGEVHAYTRAYAAPEQVAPPRSACPAADVWCWAVSVLHMFSGMVTWSNGVRAPDALARYQENGPTRPGLALMPVPVVRLLEECFRSDPSERPPSTVDITERLEEIYYDVTNTRYEGPGQEEQYDSEHLVAEDTGGRPSQPPQASGPRRRFSPRRRKPPHGHAGRRPDHQG